MSVKRLDNGDLLITIPNPHTLAGKSSRTLQKPWVDEVMKFLDGLAREEVREDWPPASVEHWDPEGGNAFISRAPDGRTAVILQTREGLWSGKWREPHRDTWVTRRGIAYTPDEIIELFRRSYAPKRVEG